MKWVNTSWTHFSVTKKKRGKEEVKICSLHSSLIAMQDKRENNEKNIFRERVENEIISASLSLFISPTYIWNIYVKQLNAA